MFEKIYIHPPPGYQVQAGYVSKINKTLYGLKRTSRQCNAKLTQTSLTLGFHQSCHDCSLFVNGQNEDLIVLLVYVDDILVISPKQDATTEVKQTMHDMVKIKDLGEAIYFLGNENYKRRAGYTTNSGNMQEICIRLAEGNWFSFL